MQTEFYITANAASLLADINWSEVGALGACATPLGLLLIWVISAVMDRRLNSFLEKLNGTYLRKELAEARFSEVHRRIDEMHERAAAHGD